MKSGSSAGNSSSGYKGYSGSGSGYNNRNRGQNSGTSKHSGRNSRNKPRNKKGFSGGDKKSGKEGVDRSKDDKAKPKGEPTSFSQMWQRNEFLPEALSEVVKSGLSVDTAINAAEFKTPGRVTRCLSEWEKISQDQWVLRVVRQGYKLQFTDGPPPTPFNGRNPPASDEAKNILDIEAAAVVEKGAARIVTPDSNEVTSGFFARPKKEPGKWRPIVNLKYLNTYLRQVSFKMTTVADIRIGVQPGYYFASLDLTDAYYSIPLHPSAWPFVRFVWRGVTYEYMTLLFGLASSPRVFTKMVTAAVKFLKVVFLIWLTGYIDDFMIMAKDPMTCMVHTHICILVFHILGFEVNMKKSSLVPSTRMEHLGFVFDSEAMTLSLPENKIEKIVSLAKRYMDEGACSADQLRSLIGTLESVRPAVELAPLHYRSLQKLLRPLQRGKWFGSQTVQLTPSSLLDLAWWRRLSLASATAPLKRGSFTMNIKADAAGNFGWGGHSSRGEFCQGEWLPKEIPWHINKKELESAYRSLDCMMQEGDFVNMFLDSRTAVAFINKMGGTRSSVLCNTALDLWKLVLERKGWIRANWLPREMNQVADMLSKSAIDTWEVALSTLTVQALVNKWFQPSMDLFASKQCHVTAKYCSWYPDSQAVARDAFSILEWPNNCYCFPPVPLISLMLDKIQQDKVQAIIVVPLWPISVWWPRVQQMMLDGPLQLGYYKEILSSPLGLKLPYLEPLVACLVTG